MLEKDDSVGGYQLVKFLGRGQFGEVWLAEKKLQFSAHGVSHALKFLSNLGDEVNLKAAEAEVGTWIKASGHPNVMSVIDMFVTDNHIIIVSEFAGGGSLGGWLKQNGGKASSDEDALEMMRGILHGIEHLHSRDIVHRDLKPDNILLQENFPRITDFGISRIVSSGTLSTKPIGSPAYMSPEAFNGSKSPQTDIWSAGVILYEMLSGGQPYEDEVLWLLIKKIQEDEPKSLPGYIRPELRAIVENALQKNPDKRFQTATEMRLAVERAIYNLKSGDHKINIGEIEQKHSSTEKIENIKPTDLKTLVLTNESIEKTVADFDISQNDSDETVLKFSDENSKNIQAEKTVELKNFENDQKTIFPLDKTKNIVDKTQLYDVDKTGGEKIEKTVNWQESEKQKVEDREAELLKIGEDLKHHKTGGSLSEKKSVGIYAAIIGGLIGLSLIGFLIWKFAGEKSSEAANAANSNSPNKAENGIPNAPEKMVYVSGGDFTMGRDDGKSEAEKPAHKVFVKPFFMDIYEVTNENYLEFVKATNHKTPSDWKNGSFAGGQATFPVVGIDWNDANDYAKWAEKRLPSEEEWEFAARGTENFIYPWGSDWKTEDANVGSQDFAEVGKYKGASPFGIYDMSGNAWEWTASDFKAYPNGKLPEAFAGKTNLKTIRGGSFEATKDFATTTYRIGWAATGAENYSRTGFRCAKDIN